MAIDRHAVQIARGYLIGKIVGIDKIVAEFRDTTLQERVLGVTTGIYHGNQRACSLGYAVGLLDAEKREGLLFLV
jgi:hypothetical protein